MSANITVKALQLLKDSDSYSLPVDVKKITKHLSIRVVEDAFDEDVSGLLVVKEGKAAIGVNKSHSTGRKQFTIAHEIAHYVLHHKNDNDMFVDKKLTYFRASTAGKRIDRREIEANCFAADLLMPSGLLRSYIKGNNIDLDDDIALCNLAKFLNVSEQALTVRLLTLGLTEVS